MGNPKQKWTSEEEEALRAGIAKHGTGKWKDIQRDPEFHPFLASRSNIDLKDDLLEGLPNFVKDKWRNMSISAGIQGSRDKSRRSKTKATQVQDAPPPPPAAAQLSNPQASSVASATVARYATSTLAVDDSSKGSSDGKTLPMYNAMIFEALSTSKDPYGLETSRIVSYIEQRHEVPPNFRRLLSTRLRRLVSQDKIEKDQNFYRMKGDSSLGTKTPTLDRKQEHSQLTQVQDVGCSPSIDPIKEAAEEAARCVADVEQKDAMLAESSRELEMIVKMQVQAEANLLLAKELYERCSKGEIVQIR